MALFSPIECPRGRIRIQRHECRKQKKAGSKHSVFYLLTWFTLWVIVNPGVLRSACARLCATRPARGDTHPTRVGASSPRLLLLRGANETPAGQMSGVPWTPPAKARRRMTMRTRMIPLFPIFMETETTMMGSPEKLAVNRAKPAGQVTSDRCYVTS